MCSTPGSDRSGSGCSIMSDIYYSSDTQTYFTFDTKTFGNVYNV